MPSRLRKVLVANRGEIAVRIIRTARDLGLDTIAAYSSADADSLHVQTADEAVCVGGETPRDSYLNRERLIGAALAAGADCVHPGYGFLAENPTFADDCEAAGLVFIGPPVAAMQLMGDKRAAKRRMQEISVPVVPGYDGEEQSLEALQERGAEIGLPLMIKAGAGGGGRGMRLVTDGARLGDALRAARQEASAAFGDGSLLLEKALFGARHVEVQVFADRHGNVVHLGDRDCSMQRRHQKVLEESPSPDVDERQRERLTASACRIAAAIGYTGAGTIEFLLTREGDLYFLEMNTRLQVEHPVTEMVTGLDLVAWQFLVAAGERLPCSQDQVVSRGHAVEARLCAEDPAAGFRPHTGRILDWCPYRAAHVRVDHGLARGARVSPFYDSLLAKIVATGKDRDEALARLHKALRETVLFGVPTNRPFLLWALESEAFRQVRHDVQYIDRAFEPSGRWFEPPGPEALALAGLLYFLRDRRARVALRSAQGQLRWPVSFNWTTRRVTMTVQEDGNHFRIATAEGDFDISEVAEHAGEIAFLIGRRRRRVKYLHAEKTLHLDFEARTLVFSEACAEERDTADSAQGDRVLSPLSGRVVEIRVRPGAAVAIGDVLIVVEAMKMQHALTAPRDTTVESVDIREGDVVEIGAVLMKLAAADEAPQPGAARQI